ncbi:MAG: TatD family hydrolase [Thermodesulfobacteriota bacterium]
MVTDSHAHLDMPEYDQDRDEVLKRAFQAGVRRIIAIGTDLESSLKALEIAGKYEGIFSTVGYHPHNAKDLDANVLDRLRQLALEPKVVAWGEIGLDFFRRHSPPDRQRAAFHDQMDLARQLGLPVIIHSRDANKEILQGLRMRKNSGQSGVVHCFSGDYRMAVELLDLGFYISIPGTVTYKNASVVQDVATRLPLDRLLVETDAPYLTPVPHRGKRNEPLFVTHTVRKIAELRHLDFEEVAERTSENTKRLFRLP